MLLYAIRNRCTQLAYLALTLSVLALRIFCINSYISKGFPRFLILIAKWGYLNLNIMYTITEYFLHS